MYYTREEKVDLLECYIANNKSPALALRQYRAKFPNRRLPEKKIFAKIYQQFRTNGSVLWNKRRRRTVLDENKQLDILLHFEDTPETSTRLAASDIDVKRTTLQTCLNINSYKPFKFKPVQKLQEADLNLRLEFCNTMMDRHFLHNIFQNIIWTDESIFTTSTFIFNRKNMHYWSSQNKKSVFEVNRQGRRSVKVWCAIWRSRILGPIFYQQNLTSVRYLNLLRNEILPLISNNIPQWEHPNLIWQQDGAPYHRSAEITRFLNENFREWIGQNGTIFWPARSPDLTPMDFFLWGTLKDIVYKNKPSTVLEVHQRVHAAINHLNETNYVSNAIRHLEVLYTTCILQNGGHTENLI